VLRRIPLPPTCFASTDKWRRPWDLRCESCPAEAHRSCLGLASVTYAGGWFRCPGRVLAASRDGSTNASGSARLAELACDWVELASSAVGPSSTSTYEDGRRSYTRFVTNVAGAQLWNGDLNQQLVCLLVTHAVQSGLSKSTLAGTLSALADW
jgi:hypothetical protein